MSGNYNRKDSYYQQAKESGYRSRAYFKLRDIQNKFSIMHPGDKVLDLGAWPGGWLQCAARHVGPQGLVTGIDLQAIEPLPEPQVHLIQGDMRDDESLEAVISLAQGKYDVLVSDMSPKLSGVKEVDRLAAVSLLELALWVADAALRPGGIFVAKAFKSNESEEFYRTARPKFDKLVREELKSTRKTSNEFYIVGFSFKGN